MATLNEITYNLALQVGKAEDNVFLERVKFMVGYYRALLIRQDQLRNHSLPTHFIQAIDCLEMEASSAMECCDAVDIGCDVWRTKRTIPRPVRLYDGSSFAYVGGVDGVTPYQPTTPIQVEYMQYSKYAGRGAQYVYRNDRIYVVNARPAKILVRGIFERPEQLGDYLCCDGSPVFAEDKEYPVSMDMVQRITQSILATELSVQNPQDDHDEVQLNQ